MNKEPNMERYNSTQHGLPLTMPSAPENVDSYIGPFAWLWNKLTGKTAPDAFAMGRYSSLAAAVKDMGK